MSVPVPSKPRLSDEAIRTRIFRAVSQQVRELTDGRPITRISKELGREIVEAVTEIIFTAALEHGYFRFPGGYGSLKVARLKQNPRPKRLPTGEVVTMRPNRIKVRYEEGAVVREELGMPPKTNYQRRYRRRSKLSKRTLDLLAGTV